MYTDTFNKTFICTYVYKITCISSPDGTERKNETFYFDKETFGTNIGKHTSFQKSEKRDIHNQMPLKID